MMKFRIFLLFFLLLGCGVKKRQEERRYRQTGVMETLRQDSLIRERLAREWAIRKMEALHIEWMKPDSTGGQAVRSATFVRSAEEAGGEASSALRAGTVEKAKGETETAASYSGKVQVKTGQGMSFWWIAVVLLCGIGVYYNGKKANE
ncbi:MAG: hypothetical protein LBQ39_03100 [Tannerellaceae bacterium]|jgi:hypothetical protein|nr:hypothetical protein [Tannerellaceae bacterium]